VALYNKKVSIKDCSVIIRNPEVEDAKQVIDLIKLIDTESTFLLREPGEFTISVEREKELIEFWIDTPYKLFLVAEVNDEIVATCGLSIDSRKRCNHKGDIGISVKKDYWNKGIGRALLEECINWSIEQKLEKLELEVDTDNERAFYLYQKLGFKIEGKKVHDKKMADGTYKDSYVMALFL